MGQERLGHFGALIAEPPGDAWMYPRPVGLLESEVFLKLVTSVQDQGALGSCTGQAFAKALEIIDGTGREFSPLGLYYNNRMFSNLPLDQDTGAYMEESVKSLTVMGAGSEAFWPYDITKFATKPPAVWRQQALDHRVESWYRTGTVEQARAALSNGYPIVAAFEVPPGFSTTGRTGEWVDEGGSALGGHAVVIVGYDDQVNRFLVCNSWGETWGTHHPKYTDMGDGYFWLPYTAFDGPRWYDAIVITKYDETAGG